MTASRLVYLLVADGIQSTIHVIQYICRPFRPMEHGRMGCRSGWTCPFFRRSLDLQEITKVMPVPRIVSKLQAYQHLSSGINAIADLLGPTLGPVGGVVAHQQDVGRKTELLDDSATAVRRIIQMHDPDSDVGAMFMRAMIWQIGQEVGDGGTVAAVLARAIFNESARLTAAGFSPVALAQGLQAGCEEVVQYLRTAAVPIGDEDELAALARSIIEDPDLAQVMGEMSYLLGPDAHINVHKFVAPYLQQFYHPGGHYKAQIASMHFYTDKARRKAVLPTGRIALVDKNLDDPVDIIAILQAAHAAQAGSLTILANNFSDQTIGLLMANNRPPRLNEFDESALEDQEPDPKHKDKLPIVAIQMKFVGEERVLAYQDLALLTGATTVGNDIGKAAEDIAPADLGDVNRLEVDTDSLYLLAKNQFDPTVRQKAAELRRRLAETAMDDDNWEILVRRVSTLSGGVGQLKIGANSKVERELLADLAKRTIRVLSKAQSSGVVPGAGASLVHACIALDMSDAKLAPGKRVLAAALCAPMEQIMANSYIENAGVHIQRVRDAGPQAAFDAYSGEVKDAFEAAILDVPDILIDVMRTAVSNSVMAITTDAIVYHKKPEQSFTPY